MPKYVLIDTREVTLKPTILIECEEVQVRLTNTADGLSNFIGAITADGRLRLTYLDKGWAKRAGIQCDKEGKIQIV